MLAVWLAVLAVSLPSTARADDPTIALSSLEDGSRPIGRAHFLEERSGPITLDRALRAEGWEPITADHRKLGITANKVWVRFRLENDTGAPRRIVVTHDITRLTTFTAFVLAPDGTSERVAFDATQPYVERPLAHAGPAAVVTVPDGATREIVVRFGSVSPVPLHLDLRVWSELGFQRHSVANTAYFVFWIGCLCAAAAFWLLYGVFMRQARLIVYALYMAGVASAYVIFSGIGLQFLFPSGSWLQQLGFNWSILFLFGTALEFARRHLDIARLHPVDNRILRTGILLYGAGTVLAVPDPFPAAANLLVFFAFVTTPLYIAWLSWRAWRRDGLDYARWMLIGWGGVVATCLMVTVASVADLAFLSLSHIDFLRFTFASTVVESLLLSASLAQWLRGQEVRRIAAEHAASRDALTGLLNRRGFDAQVAHLRAAGRWPGRYWLVLIDLDRFKQINDTHSHAAGDTVLRHFASLLRREFRADDVTARFGGEEFILLFEAGSKAAARGVAERVRRRFAGTPTRFEGAMIAHTLSAGVVRVADGPADDPANDEATLIAMADTALYAAKRSGRDCVCLYSELPQEVRSGPMTGGGASGRVVDLAPADRTAANLTPSNGYPADPAPSAEPAAEGPVTARS